MAKLGVQQSELFCNMFIEMSRVGVEGAVSAALFETIFTVVEELRVNFLQHILQHFLRQFSQTEL